ncbi:MAG TPA: molybdate ABC transporter permease subunit [Phycisphaerae bacterium]|nr:molybdate ABC transporter permease subunit [Phycisphaerae bacterium]
MNWDYVRPWGLSVEVAVVATALDALVAIPLAYVLARRRFLGRWAVESLIILPLVLPPTVVGFGLMVVLGRHGVYGWMTGGTLLFTLKAAVVASAIVSFPLQVLPMRAAFAALPKEFDEEARIAGLTRLQRLLHIALPLARGGIISGVLLGFARALGEFGATLMLLGTGESTRTLPIQIYFDAGVTADYGAAWPAAVALAGTSVVVIVVANRVGWK